MFIVPVVRANVGVKINPPKLFDDKLEKITGFTIELAKKDFVVLWFECLPQTVAPIKYPGSLTPMPAPQGTLISLHMAFTYRHLNFGFV